MSELRVVMEAFVVGELDYAGLQRKLSEDLSITESYESALESLNVLCRSENLSPAVVNLLRRSIDRHFKTDNTDPFPDIRPAPDEPGSKDQAAPGETDGLPPMFAEDAPAEHAEAESPRSEMATEELPAGAVLAGRYELEGLIGRGGSGLVYRALDRCRATVDEEGARVAVKMLRPELAGFPPARARLLREGEAGLGLRHPNLVRVFDVGMDGDRIFLTMELLEGDTLRGAIVKRSPDGFPTAQARKLICGIGEGLACLHERSLVHGDLKPGNIYVTGDGVPKLLDFGTARAETRAQEPLLEGTGAPARTPAYASPELLAGEPPDARDDVFALACVACELSSSRHPFGRVQSDEALKRRLRPALPTRLGARQRRALTAALSFRRRARPVDARAFLDMMGMGATSRKRPGFVAGAMAGLAMGVVLALSIIHPQGPLGRLLPFEERPASAEAERVPPAAAGPVSAGDAVAKDGPVSTVEREEPRDGGGGAQPVEASAPRTAGGTDIAGRFVPAVEPADAPEAANPSTPSSGPAAADSVPPVATPRPGRLGFSSAWLTAAEESAVVIATITRTGGSSGTVSVRWRTVPGSAEPDSDYISSDWKEITLADGQTSERVYVPMVNDGLSEGQENFFIELAEPGGGAALSARTRLEVRITDDESG
jgi:serine/threonine protein kinase